MSALGKKIPLETTEEKEKPLLWDWPLKSDDGIVKVTEDDKHFEVALDATFFEPKDITVKVVNDLIEVHFEHELHNEKFGTVSRNITRNYRLPHGVNPKTVKSSLANNMLTIRGMKQ